MAHQTPLYSPNAADRALEPYALVQARAASWRRILPSHRIPVIAKTPLMVALGVYLAGGDLGTRAVALTMALTALLWAALYALNEATDLRLEQRLNVPRALPLALGAVVFVIGFFAVPLSF